MDTTILTKKFIGTFAIVVALLATSLIGASSAAAYFSLSGAKLSFHGIVQASTPDSMTLLTSSTEPLEVIINSHTKFPKGTPDVGDVVFVVAKIRDDGRLVAQSVKKSKSGGTHDIYGTNRDAVIIQKLRVGDTECPWYVAVWDPKSGTDIGIYVKDAQFIGAANCAALKSGDTVSIYGMDTVKYGFTAKTVIRHNPQSGHWNDHNDNKSKNKEDRERDERVRNFPDNEDDNED